MRLCPMHRRCFLFYADKYRFHSDLRARIHIPSASVIYSQSGKTNESGGPWDYDPGKKTLSRKRHALWSPPTAGRSSCCPIPPVCKIRIAGRHSSTPHPARFPLSRRCSPMPDTRRTACGQGNVDRREDCPPQAQSGRLCLQPKRWVAEFFFA